jgi:hypothetical protein
MYKKNGYFFLNFDNWYADLADALQHGFKGFIVFQNRIEL